MALISGAQLQVMLEWVRNGFRDITLRFLLKMKLCRRILNDAHRVTSRKASNGFVCKKELNGRINYRSDICEPFEIWTNNNTLAMAWRQFSSDCTKNSYINLVAVKSKTAITDFVHVYLNRTNRYFLQCSNNELHWLCSASSLLYRYRLITTTVTVIYKL